MVWGSCRDRDRDRSRSPRDRGRDRDGQSRSDHRKRRRRSRSITHSSDGPSRGRKSKERSEKKEPKEDRSRGEKRHKKGSDGGSGGANRKGKHDWGFDSAQDAAKEDAVAGGGSYVPIMPVADVPDSLRARIKAMLARSGT